MISGSIDSIESLGLYDGPGIRVVVFMNGCMLRCKYCHNPEMWLMRDKNITSDELVKKILRFQSYISDGGGVTFSGGEPLLQPNFLIDCCIDLIIFDVKHADPVGYKELVSHDIEESHKFLEVANKMNKKFWIRQVIVPGVHDNLEYLNKLKEYLKRVKNIEKIEFLPYHKLGTEKYETLKLDNPYKDKKEMNKDKCDELYQEFLKL